MIEEDYIKIIGEDRQGDWIIIVDHASNFVPPEFNNLGLSQRELNDHMAWDLGVWSLSKLLGEAIDAPVIGGTVSRLVVDLNRYPSDLDGSIPQISDGVVVPLNQGISDTEREERLRRWFYPYHNKTKEFIDRYKNGNAKLMLVHSFTPRLRAKDEMRPWEIGFISDKNRRLTQKALAYFENSNWCVGDNEPYAPLNPDSYALPEYGEKLGRDYLVIELRNDTITDDAGVTLWSGLLIDMVHSIDQSE